MKLIVNREVLSENIQHVLKAVSTRTTIPILTGIKFSVDENGLELTASDSDISIKCTIPFELENKPVLKLERMGSVVLPARYVSDMIKKLPQQEICFEVNDRFITSIRSGSSEITLNGLDPEEFPLLPYIREEKIISIPSMLLKSMIRQTAFAVSTSETRPILTGIMWSLEEGKLKFTATDSHRLASHEVYVESGEHLSFTNIVVPGKSMNELFRIIPENDDLIDIIVTDNQILFKSENILFYSRLLEGNYPDTTRIIPQTSKTEILVKTEELLSAIERASLIAKDNKNNVVKLVTNHNEHIEITSFYPEIGKVTEIISTEKIDGEEIKISFNAKFMLDALRSIDDSQVYIRFTGAMSPFVIKPINNDMMLHLILPVRTY
ncbi:DNA polymerase III subunit beta [Microaerobacter geothermalis]|uniref:DNA polymerase III subunit beta n=1 Tax=Microaerobacter geothermalis TaxID=674972 RepID=UPI001F345534|nr:DNA polymerase III subunit beta [Microaerobacter geothermalis]MCF6095093.1 DNA polymerase III subunit beta [Microaerobacter geothermalis]